MQNFLWTTKFLEGVTQVRQVALSPFFFEVAGYNCGQMRTQKWFRLTDPILVPSLYLGTEIGSAGRTLNRPLQKARFTLQALLEFDRRVWMDRLTVYIHDLGQGDACIVAVARLVSLWRNTCNYNGGGPVHTAQNFNGFTGPISRAVSVTTGSPKLLLRMWYDPIRSLRRLFFLAFVSCSCHTAYVLMKLESDTGHGCQSRQEDGQSAVLLFLHVSGHP